MNTNNNPPTFLEFIEANSLCDDRGPGGKLDSALWKWNVEEYFNKYMAQHGHEYLEAFWNSRSDACPLECTLAEQQVEDFDKFLKQIFE